MPATEFHRASASRPSFGRSLLSIGREQANSMDSEATSLDNELEAFQKQVAERFSDLSNVESDELLSIQWIKKLLDVFLCCQEEFRAIIFNNQGLLNKSPLDRYVSEFFERSVKALDVCNAIRDGIEQIRQWKKQLEIVLCAFHSQRTLGEGHFRRAKKALIDLVVSMLDEKDSGTSQAQRNRSFGRTNPNKSLANSRSLSWSVSRSWSAAKQLQAIGNNLVAPKTNEVIASNGLVIAVFTMNYVLLFVMWALVAAIPCQDRGLQTHFYITRQYIWASHILSLHDKIIEESKKRDKRNSCGLLKEINEVEKCVKMMNVVMDCVEFPLSEEKEEEVRQSVKELGMVYEAIKDNLDPLEKQVREVFHRIVRSRTDGLDSIGRTNNQD